jgi:hypothetical protein
LKTKIDALRKRGYIEEVDLEPYKSYSKQELVKCLDSKIATDRSIAASILVKSPCQHTAELLLARLKKETKLYTKLAICNSLSSFGEDTAELLVKHLGCIGNNQHRLLPDQPFLKNNYPLPRDLVARILGNMGPTALKPLEACLQESNRKQVLEAIDAIGYISFYHQNDSLENTVLAQFELYKADELVLWKLLRCLQSFNSNQSINTLKRYTDSKIMQLSWEATRSLNQIARRIKKKR